MADSTRIDALERMLAARPGDPRAHFGLALEHERLGQHAEVVRHLEAYLAASEDEGNAYGRLARALVQLGREGEAAEALRRGIAAAGRHGHPTLAGEFEEELEELESAR